MIDVSSDPLASPPAAANADELPAATGGAIRRGTALVRLDRPLPAGWRFGLEAANLSDSGAAATAVLWAAGPGPGLDQAVALPLDGPLVQALWPVAAPPSGGSRRLGPGPSYELAHLVPLQPADAKRLIFNKRTRHRDVGTLEFVMDQVLRSPFSTLVDKVEAVLEAVGRGGAMPAWA